LWNDKIVSATSSDNEIPDYLRTRHLLIIGSPFCNLMARKVNNNTFFRFNIDKDTLHEINRHEDSIRGIERRQKELQKILQNLADQHDEWKIHLRGAGFIDPIRQQKNAGAFAGRDDDYATVSFCRHPYSKEHYAVIVAGLHLPGTMAGVRALAEPPEPDFFVSRPLGGILKTIIPMGDWYERLTRSDVEWFTPKYTIADLEAKSAQLVDKGIFDSTDQKEYLELLNQYRDVSLQDFLSCYIHQKG
jgi:hypothetical protein